MYPDLNIQYSGVKIVDIVYNKFQEWHCNHKGYNAILTHKVYHRIWKY